eukprot:5789397-Pyramimonas_sp.AAC.1
MSFGTIGPRQLLELDDAGLEVLADIIEGIEREASWSKLVTKVCFIQKRTGGVRPIALSMAISRVQARLRRDVARPWEARNSRAFWWATQGRSCERAIWHQTAMSEWATQKGAAAGDEREWTAVAVLLDLLQAYEQVRHHWMAAATIETGYPLWQLRLSLQLDCDP